jgi:hypothetical protein
MNPYFLEISIAKGAAGFMSNSAFAACPMKFSYILTLFEMVVKMEYATTDTGYILPYRAIY